MIKLTDRLSITADNHQYTLGTPIEVVDKETGKSITLMKNTTYYTTLASAVKAAVSRTLKRGVAKSEITTLQEFLKEQQKLQSKLEALIKPLDI